MSAERFTVSEVNPNESVGGGGCLCSEAKLPECQPPYVIFHHTETASNISPHAVACKACVQAAARAVEGEALAAGERDPVKEELPEAETTSGGRAGEGQLQMTHYAAVEFDDVTHLRRGDDGVWRVEDVPDV